MFRCRTLRASWIAITHDLTALVLESAEDRKLKAMSILASAPKTPMAFNQAHELLEVACKMPTNSNLVATLVANNWKFDSLTSEQLSTLVSLIHDEQSYATLRPTLDKCRANVSDILEEAPFHEVAFIARFVAAYDSAILDDCFSSLTSRSMSPMQHAEVIGIFGRIPRHIPWCVDVAHKICAAVHGKSSVDDVVALCTGLIVAGLTDCLVSRHVVGSLQKLGINGLRDCLPLLRNFDVSDGDLTLLSSLVGDAMDACTDGAIAMSLVEAAVAVGITVRLTQKQLCRATLLLPLEAQLSKFLCLVGQRDEATRIAEHSLKSLDANTTMTAANVADLLFTVVELGIAVDPRVAAKAIERMTLLAEHADADDIAVSFFFAAQTKVGTPTQFEALCDRMMNGTKFRMSLSALGSAFLLRALHHVHSVAPQQLDRLAQTASGAVLKYASTYRTAMACNLAITTFNLGDVASHVYKELFRQVRHLLPLASTIELAAIANMAFHVHSCDVSFGTDILNRLRAVTCDEATAIHALSICESLVSADIVAKDQVTPLLGQIEEHLLSSESPCVADAWLALCRLATRTESKMSNKACKTALKALAADLKAPWLILCVAPSTTVRDECIDILSSSCPTFAHVPELPTSVLLSCCLTLCRSSASSKTLLTCLGRAMTSRAQRPIAQTEAGVDVSVDQAVSLLQAMQRNKVVINSLIRFAGKVLINQADQLSDRQMCEALSYYIAFSIYDGSVFRVVGKRATAFPTNAKLSLLVQEASSISVC